MKVSIITATYNSESTILTCLRSIYDQTYDDIEHIVIDGCSRDSTVNIVSDSKWFNTKFISEKDSGVYSALNKGLSMATGEIICFLHSDDFYARNTIIQEIVDTFMKMKEIDGVYGNLVFISRDSGRIIREWKSNSFMKNRIKKGWMLPHPTLFLRSKVYREIGFFREEFRISGDYDYLIRVFKNGTPLFFIPKILIYMRWGGISTGSFKSIIQKAREDIEVLKINGYSFPHWILLLKILRKLPQFLLIPFGFKSLKEDLFKYL